MLSNTAQFSAPYQGDLRNRFIDNMRWFETFDAVDKSLMLAFMKWIQGDKQVERFAPSSNITQFVDERSEIIRLDVTSNNISIKNDEGTVVVAAQLPSRPVAIAETTSGYVVYHGKGEYSQLFEIITHGDGLLLNELYERLRRCNDYLFGCIDVEGNIRMTPLLGYTPLFLRKGIVKVDTDVYRLSLSSDSEESPEIVFEYDFGLGIVVCFAQAGIFNSSYPEVEVPLCGWRLAFRDTTNIAETIERIRKLYTPGNESFAI